LIFKQLVKSNCVCGGMWWVVWLWRISFLENLTYTTIWGIL